MTDGLVLAPPVDDDLRHWERQAHESPEAFHAFTHYLEQPQGQRSIDRAWRDHQVKCRGTNPPIHVRAKNWHSDAVLWGWVQRVDAWDAEMFRQTTAKVMKDRVDAQARHVRMAQAALQVLTLPSRATMEVLQDPAVLARYIADARESSRGLERLVGLVIGCAHALPGVVDVERLSLGLTTESVEITATTERSIGYQIPANPESVALAQQLLDSLAGTGEGTPPADSEGGML